MRIKRRTIGREASKQPEVEQVETKTDVVDVKVEEEVVVEDVKEVEPEEVEEIQLTSQDDDYVPYKVQKVISVGEAIEKLMTADGMPTEDITLIKDLVNLVMGTTTYVKSVRDKVKQILSDQELTIIDIPYMTAIMMETEQQLIELMDVDKVQFDRRYLKYVVYGILKFMVAHTDAQATEFDTMFNTVWKLVEFDYSGAVNKIKKHRGLCC